MLVAAAPTTRKHMSAIIVMARVKQFSVPSANHGQFAENWALIKA
jgi:hypothetical protein